MVMGSLRQEADVVVIGGGPGGYVAAIRAADLGREVVLVDERDRLGGTCLLEGCIPSKVLLGAVGIMAAARAAGKFGIAFGEPSIDRRALLSYKEEVVSTLASGVDGLLKRRNVEVIKGRARFEGSHALSVEGAPVSGIDFRHAVIAAGSRPIDLPVGKGLEVWSSAEALKIPEIPERLVVVGGGYIGLELGLVYAGLGSKITVVDLHPRLLEGADADLVDVMLRHSRERFGDILTGASVVGMERTGGGFVVSILRGGETLKIEADRVLVAVGRRPATDGLGLEKTGAGLDGSGRIVTDEQCRTADPAIFAVGDATAGPMLAHKASREAKVAAEVIAGHPSAFDNRAVPAAIFTDPEIAWAGLTEQEAKERSVSVRVGKFPLRALGRAVALGRTEGMAKVLSDPESGLVRGVGLVGPHASELIAEAVLAIEMGATVEDLMVTIHPHPTLSEAVMEAAEAAAGMPTHTVRLKKGAA